MGNRAMILFAESKAAKVEPFGIYLHWNGGPESVQAFLAYANEQFASRGPDMPYLAARMCQIIGNFFNYGSKYQDVSSLGIMPVDPDNIESCDRGDNGIYILAPSGDDKAPIAIINRKDRVDRKRLNDTIAHTREANAAMFGRNENHKAA